MNANDDSRLGMMTGWLHTLAGAHGLELDTLQPASSDASFRRYFRLQGRHGSVIVMDAPPPQEDCRPFVHVTQLLQDTGLRVPGILEADVPRGFLLLTDLGNQTYYGAIQQGLDDTSLQQLYRRAIDSLVRLQAASITELPPYDAARLRQELEVFDQWYVQRHCGVQLDATQRDMLEGTFAALVRDNASQPSVLVHRDFHSPNLMMPAENDGQPGVIDYQDALAGPLTYDIASLVMDARTTWEEPQQLDWAIRYWEAARRAGLPIASDFADFHRAYEWMSLQRNLRILGVFCRLSHRDDKHHYLDHIPRVMGYVRQVASRYNAFRPLLRLLDTLENRPVTYGYTF